MTVMKAFSANVLGTVNLFVNIRQEKKVNNNVGVAREEIRIGKNFILRSSKY